MHEKNLSSDFHLTFYPLILQRKAKEQKQ